MDGEMDIEQLTAMIEKISTVSGADIRGMLYSLVDVLPDVLSNGEIARIGELGYFRISLSSTGNEKEEDVTSASVRNSRIIFTPGPRLKDILKTLKYSKL
jgi:predicted histone-like DNA-binding protein